MKTITISCKTCKLHYIADGDGLCAILEDINGTRNMYYVFTDHLGSYDKIYNDGGTKVEEYSFDAWGRRRNPTNWTYTGTITYNFTSRGFTGHEHIDGFDVINMNGRCYDPYLGRFLSPDNYVQMPDFTQNFNRYAYCLNNPLKYTDPSGEFLTWGINDKGFSIGFNLTPIGIPLGAGINVGWGDGASLGGYGEVGYRVGGTGLGAGATTSQSLDYNFKHDSWSTTNSAGAYASLGPLTAGVNTSLTITNGDWYASYGANAGLGLSNSDGTAGIGFSVGYNYDVKSGQGKWGYGLNGYYSGNVNEETLIDREHPYVAQEGDYMCGPAVCSSFGDGITQDMMVEGFCNEYYINIGLESPTDVQVSNVYSKLSKRKFGGTYMSQKHIYKKMQQGHDIMINTPTSGIGHAVGVNRVSRSTLNYFNGYIKFGRLRIYAMNPSRVTGVGGQYTYIRPNQIRNSPVFYFYPKN